MKPTQGAQAGAETPIRPMHTIGWKERVDLVEWGVRRLRAKVDTGARTSALDVDYRLRQDPALGQVADLRLALDAHTDGRIIEVVAPVLRMVVVANSAGVTERRPLVETTVRLGPVVKRVQLTLTSRPGMRFRMILGRKALEGDFVVDVAAKFLLRKPKRV
jgi:hypothetical protein